MKPILCQLEYTIPGELSVEERTKLVAAFIKMSDKWVNHVQTTNGISYVGSSGAMAPLRRTKRSK